MKIQVKLAGLPAQSRGSGQPNAPTFETNQVIAVDVPAGATVEQVAAQAGIDRREVQKILVNGEAADWDAAVTAGDAIALTGGFQGM